MTNFKTSDFYYDLPERLIAQTPIKERDHSKLLVLDKKTGQIEHRHFYDIIEYLTPGDCLVVNDTKVMPARLFGSKKDSKSLIEILLLRRIDDKHWETLVKPGKRAKIGAEILFKEALLTGKIVDIIDEGNRIIEFDYKGIFEEILDELGEMPLPPYIHEKLKDKDRYQTIYAKYLGSAAAPTAGLHFNKALLEEIEKKGVNIARLTLHVGLGTFRPVKSEYIRDHTMHSEYYELNERDADKINSARDAGHKLICVGTTSVRTIETIAGEKGRVKAQKGWTNIFIYPGYKYKAADSLITNFHLPESTLIMLVSALAGKENIMKAYREAVEKEYRFFSFGDAMYIK